jgi:hypothetical protein
VKGSVLTPCFLASKLDVGLVGTERDVLHRPIVVTSSFTRKLSGSANPPSARLTAHLVSNLMLERTSMVYTIIVSTDIKRCSGAPMPLRVIL